MGKELASIFRDAGGRPGPAGPRRSSQIVHRVAIPADTVILAVFFTENIVGLAVGKLFDECLSCQVKGNSRRR